MPSFSANTTAKKPKILFAVKALDNITGGAERVLCDIASALSQRGYDVVVVSFDQPTGKTFYPLNEKVRLVQLGIGDTFKTASFMETLNRMRALRRKVLAEAPTVVVAFMHSMFVPAAFALAGTGIKVLGSEHIVPQHYKDRKMEYSLFLLSSFFLSKVSVLSERIKDSYHPLIKRKMIAIANPVYFPEQKNDASSRKKIILNIGRLESQKDQKTLIQAFAFLAKDYADWQVRIIGKGPLHDDLQKQIDTLRLEGRVILGGATQNISAEYVAASIFAIPSLYESFGLATAEAMAYGIPAVGFKDCPGTNELITDGVNGLLSESHDRVHQYAQCLKRLMDDADLRENLGLEARRSSMQFSVGNIADQWERFMDVA